MLYHWQRFDEEGLRATLVFNQIYCSSPSAFDESWDCRPHFNTEILQDRRKGNFTRTARPTSAGERPT